jgi:hypothetical protein
MEGNERPKKEAELSRLVDDWLNKQGIYIWVAAGQVDFNAYQNLISYIGALITFSYISCPDGYSNTLLSPSCVLGTAPTVGLVGKIYIFRMRADSGDQGAVRNR